MNRLLIWLIRHLLLLVGRLVGKLLFDLRVEGEEHIPPTREPLIIISNHFSWFDAPLLTLALPFQPAFLVATESQRKWWVRAFIFFFHGIPIWRGQVDRQAFRQALEALGEGKALGIFPEGGINPQLQELIARGQIIPELRGNMSRIDGQLVRARSGTALIAVMSKVRILPVGLIGTERVLDNLRNLRRTPVTVRIGPVFGPLDIETSLTGRARRRRLDELTDLMMKRIAALFPPERRGYYQNI